MKPAEFWKLIENIDCEALHTRAHSDAGGGSLSSSVSYESGSNKAQW